MLTCPDCNRTFKLPMHLGRHQAATHGRPPQNREALAEKQRRYYEENREALAEKQRRYYEENREAIAEKKRRYREENREAIAEKKRRYYEENREAIAEKQRRYREENREAIAEKKRRYYEENREALAQKKRERSFGPLVMLLRCVCGWECASDAAGEMFAHCARVHGRRPTATERTPAAAA